jgi:hypothetical protein
MIKSRPGFPEAAHATKHKLKYEVQAGFQNPDREAVSTINPPDFYVVSV